MLSVFRGGLIAFYHTASRYLCCGTVLSICQRQKRLFSARDKNRTATPAYIENRAHCYETIQHGRSMTVMPMRKDRVAALLHNASRKLAGNAGGGRPKSAEKCRKLQAGTKLAGFHNQVPATRCSPVSAQVSCLRKIAVCNKLGEMGIALFARGQYKPHSNVSTWY